MQVQKTTLTNGLRILTIPMKNVQTVTAMVLVGTGSEYESKEESGLAHFLEHMCFKGTMKRPTAYDILHELDSIGADYNAFTGGTYTGYYAKAHKKHVHRIVDVISDIYLNSTFPESELQKEKNVIIQEINMREDSPRTKVGDVFDELVFGDAPPGRPVIGTKKTVKSFTRQNLEDFHKKFYVPGATVVVIAGAVGKTATKTAEKFFVGMKSRKVIKKQKFIPQTNGPKIKIHFKETNQTQILIGCCTQFNMFNKKNHAANTLGNVLGGGMSSRLFTKIREELGLCYKILASFHSGLDGGMFVVRAGVGNDKVSEAIQAILSELRKIRDEGISEQELKKIKDYRLSGLVLGLETSDDFAEHFGFQELIKKFMTSLDKEAQDIEGVTAPQVKKIAQEVFKAEHLYIAIVGPHKGSDSMKNSVKL